MRRLISVRLVAQVGTPTVTEFLVTTIAPPSPTAPARSERPTGPYRHSHGGARRDRRAVVQRRARLARRHLAHDVATRGGAAGNSSNGRLGLT